MSWESSCLGHIGTRRSPVATILILLLLLASSCSQTKDEDKAITRTPGTTLPTSPEIGTGDLYAVVVGISNYANPKISKLKVSDKDAQDFASFLKTQEKLFRKVHVTLLRNAEATKREVEKHLYYELRKAGKDDTVVVFLSGHGADDPNTPGEFFFLTHDADPQILAASAVHMNRQWFLNKLDSRRVVLIADACHAGGFSGEGAKALPPSLQNFMAQFKESEGKVFITSSRADEVSREKPDLGNSLFTYYLIEGLKGGAADNDGVVTLKALYDYVYRNTKDAANGYQHPTWAGQVVGAFPVAMVQPAQMVATTSRTRTVDPSTQVTSHRAASDGQISVHMATPLSPAVVKHDPSKDAALIEAAANGDSAEVKHLLSEGADINAKDAHGDSALRWAVTNGHAGMAQLLLERRAMIDRKGALRRTALIWAAMVGQTEMVQLLLERGADVNAISHRTTALHWAATNGHAAIVKLLLDRGAYINHRGGGGKTALDIATEKKHWEVAQILQNYKDAAECDPSKDQALIVASQAGELDAVKRLLSEGAYVNAVSDSVNNEDTPLIKAAKWGHALTVRLLLDHGANISDAGERNLTALHWAAMDGRREMVQLLLDRGADVYAKDYKGKTALDIAGEKHHSEVAEILRNHREKRTSASDGKDRR